MPKFNPRKPDYRLKVKLGADADLLSKTQCVGAAWLGAKGAIHIHLDPFVVLSGLTNNMQITLFPNDYKEPDEPKI
jgi:hypothetical protein